MEQKIRKYTKEFKQESVSLALKSASIIQTGRDLGIPGATLHSWIKQLKTKTAESKLAKDQSSNITDITSLIEENRRLHKELLIAKEE